MCVWLAFPNGSEQGETSTRAGAKRETGNVHPGLGRRVGLQQTAIKLV